MALVRFVNEDEIQNTCTESGLILKGQLLYLERRDDEGIRWEVEQVFV